MDSLHRLEEIFAHFPGIGPRQAKRFVHYLQGKSPASIKEFIQLIEEVKKTTRECAQCHRFFAKLASHLHNEIGTTKPAADQLCYICSDQNRDRATLMVVARDSDFESIEKSGAYRGLYFILGGLVPILDKEPEKKIRLRALMEYVSTKSVANTHDDHIQFNEIILSLNTTSDGEHTTTIIKEALQKIFGIGSNKNISDNNDNSKNTDNATSSAKTKITILGRGLSTGAELEYADSETIRYALGNRK